MNETRSIVQPIEQITGNKLEGYAVVFNSPATIKDASGREFVEVIRPNALNLDRDVLVTFNHSPSDILGRTSSGTAKLYQDQRGLFFSVELPDYIRPKIQELVNRGDLKGASFTFPNQTVKDKWSTRDGKPYREIYALDVLECGPVVLPAYAKTSVNLRSVTLTNPLDLYEKKLRLLAL